MVMDGKSNLKMCKFENLKMVLAYLVTILSLSYQSIIAQPLHPFPAHVTYYPGTIKPSNVSQRQMDDSVRSFYNAWKQRYINSGCDLNEYYVWFELPGKECVSEGQGYGMMITALMAGY